MNRFAALQDWPVLSRRAASGGLHDRVEILGAEQEERV